MFHSVGGATTRTPEEAAEFGRNLPPGWAPRYTPGSEPDIARRAGDIEAEEYRRYRSGLSGLEGAEAEARTALSRGINTDLLFSRAADAGGLRARSAMDRLRASIGSRGIDPSSGAAGGLLARIGLQQQSDIVGAKRDIAIEDQRVRQVNAAQMFANALQLAQYRNSPVPTIGLEAGMGIMELNQRERSEQRADATARSASRTNFISGLLGGGLGLVRGLV